MMSMDDNSIDNLIQIAIHNKTITSEHKCMALNIIASKAGVNINKKILK